MKFVLLNNEKIIKISTCILAILILGAFNILEGCASRQSEVIAPQFTKKEPSLGPSETPFSPQKIIFGGRLIIGEKYDETIKVNPTIVGSLPMRPVKVVSTCGCVHPVILPSSKTDPLGGFTVHFTYAPKGPEGKDLQIIHFVSKNGQVVGYISIAADVVGVFSLHPSQVSIGKIHIGQNKIIRVSLSANTKTVIPKYISSSVKELQVKLINRNDKKAIYVIQIQPNAIPGPISGVVEWESGKANPSDPVLPVTGYIDGGWQSYPESLLFPPHGGGSPETVSFQLKHLSSNQAIHTPIYAKSDNPEIRVDLKQVKRSNVWNGIATIKPIPGHGEVMRGEMIILDGKGASLLRIPYMGIVMTR